MWIKYFNASENDPENAVYHPQFTDRAVRKLIRLWSVDECSLFDDLTELQEKQQDAAIRDDERSLTDGLMPTLVGYHSESRGALDDVQGMTGIHREDLHDDETVCDVTPLIANSLQLAVEMCNEDNEENNADEEHDSLTQLMLSQGFTLE